MTTLTAADYADTGQWRLIVKIGPGGISAHLENTIHSDVDLQELFSTTWEEGSGSLLQHIENAVYDHPRVLDDFSARIVVYDKKTLFMPTELLLDTEGAEEIYYTSVYGGDGADVMCEGDRDVTAAFMLAPGLKGFLGRTFPGARIGCNLMQKVRDCRGKNDGKTLSLSLREGEADFVMFGGSDLLSASTHSWKTGEDIVYFAFNLMNVYGVEPKDVAVFVDAEGAEAPESMVAFFGKFAGSVNV